MGNDRERRRIFTHQAIGTEYRTNERELAIYMRRYQPSVGRIETHVLAIDLDTRDWTDADRRARIYEFDDFGDMVRRQASDRRRIEDRTIIGLYALTSTSFYEWRSVTPGEHLRTLDGRKAVYIGSDRSIRKRAYSSDEHHIHWCAIIPESKLVKGVPPTLIAFDRHGHRKDNASRSSPDDIVGLWKDFELLKRNAKRT